MATRFEWDQTKNRQNQSKHGLAFELAQLAFADPRRVIAEDLQHSESEKRYYCFGKAGGGVMTVRFTYRENMIRILGAGYRRRGKTIYERENKIHNEPLGKLRIIEDFLSPPQELAFSQESVKVTIALSKASVDFFKKEARKHGTQYQKMIRRLLDIYATNHR